MRIRAVLISVVMAMPAPIAMADVLLELGDGIEVIAINGQEIDEEDRHGSVNLLRLKDGRSQLLVTYTTEIRDTGNETVLDTSSAQVFLFEAEQDRLRLMAPEIGSRHEMRAFDEGNRWRLLDSRGEKFAYSTAVLQKEGLQFDRDYADELRRFNRSDVPAAVPELATDSFAFDSPVAVNVATQSVPSTVPEGTNSSGMSDQQIVRKMLKFWYQQASSITRNDFNRWLSESQ